MKKNTPFIKLFILLLLSASILNSNGIEKVIYVENIDNKDEISLKNEFFNNNTSLYTLSIGTLTTNKHNPIDYFKTYKMKNALAYKFGENKEYIRVVSGVYKTFQDAKNGIKNIDVRLLRNKPYAISLRRHQKLFKKYNNIPITKSKVFPKNDLQMKSDSIYINGSNNSEKLKNELLSKKSKLYAISIAILPSSKKEIKSFFKLHGIEDKALAHVYGKKRDKVRVIYGLYNSYTEAQKEIKVLNDSLKKNKPYASKMKHIQSFYKRHNTNIMDNIVKLKVNDKKSEQILVKPNIRDGIKIIENKKEILKKENKIVKTKVLRKKVKIIKKQKQKKEIKKAKKIKVKRVINNNKNRYLKHSKIEDIYYIESDGNFNILNEVFLNDRSSFYTLDLGELNLNKTSIEEFFLGKSMKDNALAYKYGNKKEYARAIYGAYETKESAKSAIKSLKIDASSLKVSNIKNHQKLFKMYHENILKKGPSRKIKKSIKKALNKEIEKSYENKSSDIIYTLSKISKNRLKDEFFKPGSAYYTITLITFHKNDLTPKEFINKSSLKDNLLAFSLGSKNDYYRVIYGLFKSRKEALKAISILDYESLKNKPYISKVRTSIRRFESYNNRKVSAYKNDIEKIEIN